jgi:predicted naringenin-chalcone synthase
LALVSALGLSPGVVRTSVNFMGCYAAIHAMKMAHWICKAEPHAQVLIVCVELCTLHFQKDYSADNATSSLLFADGASAVLIAGEKSGYRPQLKLCHFYSWVDTRGKNDMTWSLSSQGFRMTLSNYVPHLLQTDILPVVNQALSEMNAAPADVTHWCIHPGGKRILEVIGKQLQLSRNQLSDAYEILAHHGNMSSCTILFVLKQMMDKMQNSPEKALVFGAAFGPGLTVETFSATTV